MPNEELVKVKNENLSAAKKAKFDEFYTQYEDIEKEMNAYLEVLRPKLREAGFEEAHQHELRP
jgi:hypothetical protein